ncbi:MAG: DUF2061 domain-containing protein [Halorhabdus sp.]
MSIRSHLRRSALQNRSRAVLKTALYRVVMILITIAVALAVTGQIGQALSIGLVTNAVKTGTYYVYERLWDRVTWGLTS